MTWARAYGAALGGTVALAPVCRRTALSLNLTTRPRPDRWAAVPKPLLGGPGMLTAITAAACALPGRRQRVPLLCGAWIAMAVGLRDDLHALGPRDKILGLSAAWGTEQIAARLLGPDPAFPTDRASSNLQTGHPPEAGCAAPAPGFNPARAAGDAARSPSDWIEYGCSLVMALAGANVFNLVDNMDGLAAGLLAVTAGAALPLVSDPVLPACLAGSCLGYMGCNAYPSGLLMGDAGSLPLGYLAGRLAWSARPSIYSILLLGVPVADSLAVVAARAIGRRSLFRGSTDHLSHRMVRGGIPEPLPAVLLCVVHACAGAAAVRRPGPPAKDAGTAAAPVTSRSGAGSRQLLPLVFTAAAVLGVMMGRGLVR